MAASTSSVVAVLGVGPGLGAALAHRFAKAYPVAINARRAEYLKSLGDEMRAAGGNVLEAPADLGDRAQIEALFATIRERLGPPDIVLYNAGSGAFGTLEDMTPEQYEDSWRVNAYGAFITAKVIVPDMLARGGRDHPGDGRDRGRQGRPALGCVRPGKVRATRTRAIPGAQPGTKGHSRGVGQRGRRDRHSRPQLSRLRSRGHAETRCHRRDLLALGAPGSQFVDDRTGSAAVQGKILRREAMPTIVYALTDPAMPGFVKIVASRVKM